MQVREGFRRAGLFLLNLTYGTTVNIAKSMILDGIKTAIRLSNYVKEKNVMGIVSFPLAIPLGFIIGMVDGFIAGVKDFFDHIVTTIRDGDYDTSVNFKDTFNTEVFYFKYNELAEVKEARPAAQDQATIVPDATPQVKTETIPHTISF